jgi:uncharacterized protein RhaS with RHS repeats
MVRPPGEKVHYYRARWYDPQEKRFITEDPIGLDGGINLYAYVGNDPLNKVDPSGKKTIVLIVYDKGPLGLGTIGGHAALYVDNGKEPILFDPAGS